jgi:probable F420-dependent oxidoreductase
MSTLRPFHFSAVVETPQSQQGWVARAKRVEDLGYTTFLVPDHLKLVDPAVGLMAAAGATSLRIGSHVFCNDFRHPVVLARQAANLDLFSGGRFRFGLGCGYAADEYAQAGIQMDLPGERLARFEEALRIIKTYFEVAALPASADAVPESVSGHAAPQAQEQLLTFSGTYYQVNGLPATIEPVQKPHPPIYVGGGGRRVLSIAARHADIVGLAARSTPRGIDWTSALSAANEAKVAWIREAAGERFSSLEFSTTIFLVVVTDHAQPVAQQLGSHLGLSAEQVLDCVHILIGSVEQITDALQERRARFGISSIEVAEAHIETLAPVVARLSGK